ncbi:dihydrolipoamide acetyltransferase family protein [Agromyces mariniharenae]|uniref:Dihydrolipoamide acetyltransferase component of pyruvate dehydrogenase complex n=1 Tax=Agromyces mariniharenae TaxID=2604423 RepID=A0A5S4V616_9MICO|nr:dihydrolipoamide acetyltransferase family protein [Agromyces mariniharenae]TYL54432.1 2-oxo acid dehydrogenase subunit E2 [Agromyces mariniharenae]
MAIVVRMPAVMAGATEASLQSWLVAPGDDVALGQPVAEIETEKAVVEYGAEDAGTVAALLVGPGDAVAVGSPILVLAEAGESADDARRAADADSVAATAGARVTDAATPTPAPADPESGSPVLDDAPTPPPAQTADAAARAEPPEESTGEPAGPAAEAPTGRRFMSPLVRRLAREHHLDLARVAGSGPGGRIVRRDVDELLTAAAASADSGTAPEPAVAPAAPAPSARRAPAAVPAGAEAGFTDEPLTPMRRAIARRLTESVTTVPHFEVRADCRIDALARLRADLLEQTGERISLNDFVVKAVAMALREVPEANAIFLGDAIRRFDGVDVAIAVALDDGLIAPVVRGVDRMPLADLARATRDLADRARSGRLRPAELSGGAFSVSNLGMYGTTEFTAIIDPPRSGILAVGAATPRPVVVDGELVAATVMTVTLSADHRVLDGAVGARWLAAFTALVEHPLRLLV